MNTPKKKPGESLFRVPAPGVFTPPQPGGPGTSAADDANIAQDVESKDRYFTIAGLVSEQLVYATQKVWTGCDVYVTLPAYNYATPSQRIATIRIYARSKGNRSLVASGRVSVTKDAGRGAIWVAAVRCDADSFEVTYEADLYPSPNLPGVQTPQVRVTVVANDRNTAIPAGLGQQVASWATTGIPQSMIGLHTDTFNLSRMRLCGVQALNRVAAPRVLQFRTTGSLGNPFASFGMPLQGSPIFVEFDGLLPGVPRYDTITVDVVTAAGAAGADGDVQWQFWFD